jgi:isoleucyl-tRNA synthetase
MSASPKSSLRPPTAEFHLPRIEEEILAFWDRHDTERKSLSSRGRPAFVFYDGPPFATGVPHYGHLLAGTIKDIIPRYFVMQGFDVERRFGWDCHGLPIESLIEKELKLNGKADVEAYGVPRFNAACRASVQRYTKEWRHTVRRMGRWVDFEHEYKTLDPDFMETVWWVFHRLWEQGLIYEGFRVQPVSPALGTPLSNFEVAQGPQERDPVTKKDGHKRRQDPSLTVRFRLEDEPAFLWVWTTTPWTLPSNLAVAVHPDVDYVKVQVVDTGEVAYIEPARLADYQARGRVGATAELQRLKGRELIGRPYQPILPYFESYKTRATGERWCFRVVGADYVTTDSGTGLVHQAPAFGEDDYQVGLREGLPVIRPMGLTGIFDERVSDFAGQFARDAEKGIIAKLKSEQKVVDHDVIVHAYPHCYRTDQPLMYMAVSTWFMKVEQLRDQLVRNNASIRWVPEHVGAGRFGNWLENARDWNLSRNRFWGTPIPVWRCDEDPSELESFGSVRALEERANLPLGSLTDLHRESVDEITFPSRKTPGGTMRRLSEVFDCWFESGSMPYAQNHYPFDASKVKYVEHNLPADFIAEGLDQTRGWFYTLHVLSTALFGRAAFKNVIVNGMILAADGKKMSKRLLNYPDPNDVMHRFGADALRAYLIDSAVVRAEPMKFGKDASDTTGECVKETVRLVVLPLWNAYVFLTTYAAADGWSPKLADLTAVPSGDLDRFILSRVTRFVAELTLEYERYELSNLIPAFTRLCEDVNNWYIRRGRRRYWRARDEGAAGDQDKQEAYATLFRVLVTLSRAMAPVMPFLTEHLHQRLLVDTGLLPAGDSVHAQPFPISDPGLIDLDLEQRVAHVRAAIALGLTIRDREKLAVRRPLSRVTISSQDPFVRAAIEQFSDAIKGELNVKEVVVSQSESRLSEVTAKANFKQLGKRLGPKMKSVAAKVAAFGAAEIARLERGESVEVEAELLTLADVLLNREGSAGSASESQGGMTVVLETQVSAELAREGLARELVSRVQSLRKNAAFTVSQRIRLFVEASGPLAEVLERAELRELLQRETLAVEVVRSLASQFPEGATRCDEVIDKVPLTIAVLAAHG